MGWLGANPRGAPACEWPLRLDATRQNSSRRSSAQKNLLDPRTSLSLSPLRLWSARLPDLIGRPVCKAERLALENRMPRCGRRSSPERMGAEAEAQGLAPCLARNQREAKDSGCSKERGLCTIAERPRKLFPAPGTALPLVEFEFQFRRNPRPTVGPWRPAPVV